MLDFKPRRQLKLKPNTALSEFLSNPGIRFVVAGFFSLLVTLLLFIFMNYLIGNFDKYAQAITENLFSLRLVQLDKSWYREMEYPTCTAPSGTATAAPTSG